MKFSECLRAPGAARALLALLVACAALSSAACSDPVKAKTQHLSRGEALLQEEKYQEAALEFRNAIQIDDSLAAAHWGLARAYEKLERFNESFEELTRTVRLDPNNKEARLKLGTYYLVGGAPRNGQPGRPEMVEEAQHHAEELLQQDPNYVPGHVLLANVLAAKGKRPEALAELNRAIELDPTRVESHVSLALFHYGGGDAAKAEEVFKRVVSTYDRASLGHVEYGKFLVQQRRLDEAEAQFRKAVEVDSKNRDVHWVLASFYLVNNRLDRAEEAYKALAALDNDRPEGRAKLADFYASTGRLDDALNIYQEDVRLFPDFLRGHYRIGELLLQKGDRAGAVAKADEILKKDGGNNDARLLRARVRLEENRFKDAIADLDVILKQEPRSQLALYFMAEAQYRDGQVEQARAFAGDLERFYPNFLPAKLMQLQINLAGNDAQLARRQATELIELVNKTAPSLSQSPQLLAEMRVRALTARGTAHVRLHSSAQAPAERAQYLAAARADMEAARDAWPGVPSSYTNLAGVALLEGKADEAGQLYERALSVDRTNFQALDGLVQLYGATNRVAEARQRMDALVNENGSSAALHYLRATAYAQGNAATPPDVPTTEAELRRTTELDPDFLLAYQKLAELYFNTNQPDRAVAEYGKIVERRPNDAVTLSKIGMVEFSRQNLDAAGDSYRRALAANPNEDVAANNLAMLYAEHGRGNIDEAVRLAQEVVRRNPEVAGYADTLGWVYYKKGLYAPAAEQLQRAVTLSAKGGQDNSVYRQHLALALAGKGDKAGARREYMAALRLAEREAASPLGRPRVPIEDLRRAMESL